MTEMTRRQKVALENPLARAGGAPHRRFFAKEGNWSTILTINK